MKLSQALQYVKKCILSTRPIMLISAPGLGKTQGIKAITKSIICFDNLPPDLMICHPIVDSEIDYKGLPGFNKITGLAEFFPYGKLRQMLEAKRPLVVFVDDFAQASQSVQKAFMQLFDERSIDGKKISEFVTFVIATNDASHGAGASNQLSPIVSRMRASITIEPDAGDWLSSFALKDNNIVPELCAFIKSNPEYISTFDKDTVRSGKPFACPRSIKFLSDWIESNDIDQELWVSCVGEKFISKFWGFYSLYKTVAPIVPQVLSNGANAQIPNSANGVWSICCALANIVNPANVIQFENIALYTNRLDAEMAAFFWTFAAMRNPSVKNSTHYTSFVLANSDLMINS